MNLNYDDQNQSDIRLEDNPFSIYEESFITSILSLSLDNSICDLIQINKINILLNCGIDTNYSFQSKNTGLSRIQIQGQLEEDFQNNNSDNTCENKTSYEKFVSFMEDIKSKNEKIDYVFITDYELFCIGMLPFLIKQFPNVTVYSAAPIKELSYYSILDFYSSITETKNFNLFTEKEIYNAFNTNFQELSLFNEISIKEIDEKNDKLFSLIAIPSGNSIGGFALKIKYCLYDILYSPIVSFNNKLSCKNFCEMDVYNPYLLIADNSLFRNIKQANSENNNKQNNQENIFMKSEKLINQHIFNSKIESNLSKKHMIFFSYSLNQSFELILSIKRIINKISLSNPTQINTMENKNNYKTGRSATSKGSNLSNKSTTMINVYFFLIGTFAKDIIESYKSFSNFLPQKTKRYLENINENDASLSKYLTHFYYPKNYDDVIENLKIISSDKDYDELENDKNLKTLLENLQNKNKFVIFLNFGKTCINNCIYPDILKNLNNSNSFELIITNYGDFDKEEDKKLINVISSIKEFKENDIFSSSLNDNIEFRNVKSDCESIEFITYTKEKKIYNENIFKITKQSINADKKEVLNAITNSNVEVKAIEDNLIDNLKKEIMKNSEESKPSSLTLNKGGFKCFTNHNLNAKDNFRNNKFGIYTYIEIKEKAIKNYINEPLEDTFIEKGIFSKSIYNETNQQILINKNKIFVIPMYFNNNYKNSIKSLNELELDNGSANLDYFKLNFIKEINPKNILINGLSNKLQKNLKDILKSANIDKMEVNPHTTKLFKYFKGMIKAHLMIQNEIDFSNSNINLNNNYISSFTKVNYLQVKRDNDVSILDKKSFYENINDGIQHKYTKINSIDDNENSIMLVENSNDIFNNLYRFIQLNSSNKSLKKDKDIIFSTNSNLVITSSNNNEILLISDFNAEYYEVRNSLLGNIILKNQ